MPKRSREQAFDRDMNVSREAKTLKAVKKEVRALKRNTEKKFVNLRVGLSGGTLPGGVAPIPTAAEVLGVTGGELQQLNENGGYVANANHMAQITTGDDGDQRIGRKVILTGWDANLQLTYTPSGTASANQSAIVRLCLIQDKSPTAALPTVCSIDGNDDVIFQNTHTADDLTKAFFNTKNSRFKLLWDKVVTFNPTDGFKSDAAPLGFCALQVKHVSVKKKLNIETTFDQSTTGTYATCSKNSIFLVMGTFQNIDACTLTGSFRTHFTD